MIYEDASQWKLAAENKDLNIKLETKDSVRGNICVRSVTQSKKDPLTTFRASQNTEMQFKQDPNLFEKQFIQTYGVNSSFHY